MEPRSQYKLTLSECIVAALIAWVVLGGPLLALIGLVRWALGF